MGIAAYGPILGALAPVSAISWGRFENWSYFFWTSFFRWTKIAGDFPTMSGSILWMQRLRSRTIPEMNQWSWSVSWDPGWRFGVEGLEISGRWEEDALKEKVHIVWLYWSGWNILESCFFFCFQFSIIQNHSFFSKKASYFGMVKLAVPFDAYKSEW